MALGRFIADLTEHLAPGTRILTNSSEEEFRDATLRWSDINVKVPGAIIKVTSELDAVTTIKTAHDHNIPFVSVCGGHSLWSTIGTDGFILDFSEHKSIRVNVAEHKVIVAGGVLMKELSIAIAEAGECAAVGNGNTIGVIPYLLGGGIGVTTGLIGVACDNILSAKIILADGRLVFCDADHEPDLFWAIKGAGVYLGAVVEISLRTYPLSILGTEDGRHWIGNFLYPLDRAEEVFKEVDFLITASKNRTAGLVMMIAPPPDFKPLIAVVPHYFGNPAEGPQIFQCLSDLKPLVSSETMPLFQNLSDHLDFACGKGGLRRFTLAGLREFKTGNGMKVTALFEELLNSCPDAAASGYFIEWHCLPPAEVVANSSFGHHDIHIWFHCLSWCQIKENWDATSEFEQRAIEAMRQGTDPSNYVDLPHGTRTGPMERRFPEEEKLSKLRALKKKFDPQGVFTKELL